MECERVTCLCEIGGSERGRENGGRGGKGGREGWEGDAGALERNLGPTEDQSNDLIRGWQAVLLLSLSLRFTHQDSFLDPSLSLTHTLVLLHSLSHSLSRTPHRSSLFYSLLLCSHSLTLTHSSLFLSLSHSTHSHTACGQARLKVVEACISPLFDCFLTTVTLINRSLTSL